MKILTQKPGLTLTLIILSAFLSAFLLAGCEETTSVVGLDKVTSRTMPQMTFEGMRDIRLSYAVGEAPYNSDHVILCDFSGILRISAEDAFESEFTPQRIYALHHFFSVEEDPINHLTRMTFISRDVFKRTDIEYHHKLPSAGYPILRDDATMIAIGTAGRPGEGRCYLGLLELRIEQVKRAIPDGYSDKELEISYVIPLAWEDKKAHAVLVLGDGSGVYFIANQDGTLIGSVELSGAGFHKEDRPKGWLDPSGQTGRFIISIVGGYFLIDTVSLEAKYSRLYTTANVLGPSSDGKGLFWTAFDAGEGRAVVWRRDIDAATDIALTPYGKKFPSASTKHVFYSYRENCIYYEELPHGRH